MTSGSAGFLPAKTPTVAYFELFLGSPRSALAHRNSRASLDFGHWPNLFSSLCLYRRRVGPRPATSILGGQLLSARALTRALLSLGVLFGRRPLRSMSLWVIGLYRVGLSLLFTHCDISAARGGSLNVLEV